METSTPKSSSVRHQLVLPLSRIFVESAERSETTSSEMTMQSSEMSSSASSSLASTLVTPIRQQPQLHHHLSRHNCLSPSNSQSTLQLELLSPSSTTSSVTHHSTVFQAQQQQQSEMTFTSAFASTLRHRRGKTLILPKLKIPRSSKADGGAAAAEDAENYREVQSSSIHQWRHSENLTTTNFRRSVSSSTFTESAAWYSTRHSSTSNMSEMISGSTSWVKTKQIRSYTCNLTGTGWGKRSYHRSKFHWHLSSVNVAPLLPIHPIRPWIHHSPLLLSIVLLFQCWDRLFFSKAYNIVDLHFSLQRQCETVVTYRSMSQLSKTFNYCEWWNWYSPDWTGFFTIDIQLASGG